MKKVYSKLRGFTLIELLVVIAIIALLTGIILTSLTSSKAKARDAQRVSDIGQLQLALELFFDRCHSYPVSTNNISTDLSDTSARCTDQQSNTIVFSNYISKIPVSPSPGTYAYVTNATAQPPVTPPTDYVLYAQLESTSSASPNSLGPNTPATKSDGYASSFNCSLTTNYCVGPK
jgi:type II secretion system protein G